jgi:hypothetical protein
MLSRWIEFAFYWRGELRDLMQLKCRIRIVAVQTAGGHADRARYTVMKVLDELLPPVVYLCTLPMLRRIVRQIVWLVADLGL